HIWIELNQFCCKSGQTLRMEIRRPINHFKIATFRVTKLSHARQKLIEISLDEGSAFRSEPQPSDYRSLFGSLAKYRLRTYRDGGEQAYDFAPSHRLVPKAQDKAFYYAKRLY